MWGGAFFVLAAQWVIMDAFFLLHKMISSLLQQSVICIRHQFSSSCIIDKLCLQFYFQAEDDEDEQMDQDDEPQMQVVLHEVRQYCYLSIGF